MDSMTAWEKNEPAKIKAERIQRIAHWLWCERERCSRTYCSMETFSENDRGMGGNRKLNKQMRKMMKDGDMDMVLLPLACDRMPLSQPSLFKIKAKLVALLTKSLDMNLRSISAFERDAPDDLEALASVEGIIRSNDVIGDLDLSNLSSIDVQQLLMEQPKSLNGLY